MLAASSLPQSLIVPPFKQGPLLFTLYFLQSEPESCKEIKVKKNLVNNHLKYLQVFVIQKQNKSEND